MRRSTSGSSSGRRSRTRTRGSPSPSYAAAPRGRSSTTLWSSAPSWCARLSTGCGWSRSGWTWRPCVGGTAGCRSSAPTTPSRGPSRRWTRSTRPATSSWAETPTSLWRRSGRVTLCGLAAPSRARASRWGGWCSPGPRSRPCRGCQSRPRARHCREAASPPPRCAPRCGGTSCRARRSGEWCGSRCTRPRTCSTRCLAQGTRTSR
mmetsp:Transcript_21018/g.50777  ORF Transcript_21018/g.50777 Transcript_21018/m.50777 type:complete len:206 (+) Transcript_21018:1100-1717(+)